MYLWRLIVRAFVSTMLLLGCAATPAVAAVEISFYSREFGVNNFPHAFVTLKGRIESDGSQVDESYGFTAKAITPAILMGSVGGKVIREHAHYIAKSDRHFSLKLTDSQYRAVMAEIDAWRSRNQPSYNLNRSNCVHFVGSVAEAAGLTVTFPAELMKKPRAFLSAIRAANAERLDGQ